MSSLNVSGVSSFNNNSTNSCQNLNVNGIINCNSVKYASTQVTEGDATFNSRLYISGASILQASTTILNTLNVSGFTTLNNNVGVVTPINTVNKLDI